MSRPAAAPVWADNAGPAPRPQARRPQVVARDSSQVACHAPMRRRGGRSRERRASRGRTAMAWLATRGGSAGTAGSRPAARRRASVRSPPLPSARSPRGLRCGRRLRRTPPRWPPPGAPGRVLPAVASRRRSGLAGETRLLGYGRLGGALLVRAVVLAQVPVQLALGRKQQLAFGALEARHSSHLRGLAAGRPASAWTAGQRASVPPAPGSRSPVPATSLQVGQDPASFVACSRQTTAPRPAPLRLGGARGDGRAAPCRRVDRAQTGWSLPRPGNLMARLVAGRGSCCGMRGTCTMRSRQRP